MTAPLTTLRTTRAELEAQRPTISDLRRQQAVAAVHEQWHRVHAYQAVIDRRVREAQEAVAD